MTVQILVFEVITTDGNLTPPFIFTYGLRLNTEAYIKFLKEEVLSWIERVATGSPCLSIELHRATQAEESCLGSLQIFATTSLLTAGLLTPQIATFLNIVYGVL